MNFERNIVTVVGGLLVLIGIGHGLTPAFTAEQAGLSATAGGLTDLRAVYGGVQFGLGCFLLWCTREASRLPNGLAAMGIVFASVGVLRVLGMLVDHEPTAFHVINLVVEACVALAAGVLLRARPMQVQAAPTGLR